MNLYQLYQNPSILFILILLISVWSLIWKGLALWKSSQKKETKWFIFLLILNTAGILPIIYLILKRDKKNKKDNQKENIIISITEKDKVNEKIKTKPKTETKEIINKEKDKPMIKKGRSNKKKS